MNKNEKYRYLEVKDIMEITGLKKTASYRLINTLNETLRENGKITLKGRVPEEIFIKELGLL